MSNSHKIPCMQINTCHTIPNPHFNPLPRTPPFLTIYPSHRLTLPPILNTTTLAKITKPTPNKHKHNNMQTNMPSYEQQRPLHQHQYQHHPISPTTRQTVKFLTASTIGTVLLVLSGLTLTGTVIALVLATPVLVLFSPILVPALITIFLIASGFVFSGGCGVAALSALSWIYQYTTGKHPPGADQLDSARMRIGNAAWEVKEKAKENLQYVQHKAQEATTTSSTTDHSTYRASQAQTS